MKIEQYPYDLFVIKIVGGGRDDDGFPIPTTEEPVFHSKCRTIAAGSGNIVTNESGDITNYSTTIVMPLGTPIIEANSKIMVSDGTKGNVIRFKERQLHCRLWV